MIIEITFIQDTKKDVNKTIYLDENRNLRKQASASIANGSALSAAITFDKLKEFIDDMPSNTAMVLGSMGRDKAKIVSGEENEDPANDIISRSKSNFEWHKDYQLCFFDYDDGGNFNLTPEEFIEVISRYLPGFDKCKKLIKPSTSANLYDKDGNKLSQSDGFHIYFIVNHPEKIEKIFSDRLSSLNVSLWNSGFGFIRNSHPKDRTKTAVAQLERNIYDVSVFSPERLIFEAKAKLQSGIVQKDFCSYMVGVSEYLDISNLDAPDDASVRIFEDRVLKAKEENAKTPYMIESEAMLVNQIRADIKAKKYEDDEELKGKSINEAIIIVRKRYDQGFLPLEHQIKLWDSTWVSVQDVLSNRDYYHKKRCYDPHEPDTYGNGSTAIIFCNGKRPNIFSHAHGGKTHYLNEWNDGIEDYIEFYKNHIKVPREELRPVNSEDLMVTYDEPNYVLPFDRIRRAKILKNKCLKPKSNNMLMYAFEGFGKSYLAYLLVVLRQKKIVFASACNEQAVEQAEQFQKLFDELNERKIVELNDEGWIEEKDSNSKKYKVQLILSRKYQLKEKYNFEAIMQHGTAPWDSVSVNKSATIEKLMREKNICIEQAMKIWDDCAAQKPDFNEYDIICTTHSRVQIWGRMYNTTNVAVRKQEEQKEIVETRNQLRDAAWGINEGNEERVLNEFPKTETDNIQYYLEAKIVPHGSFIIYDDPGIEDFRSLHHWRKSYDEHNQNVEKGREIGKKTGKEITKIVVNDREYAVRPEEYALGYGFSGDIFRVYTTTEMLTCLMIQRQFHNVYTPKLMPDQQMYAGDITLIKTEMVRSKEDGFLPLVLNRLSKEGYNYKFIADGVGSEYNHTNNKGQNCLKDKNIIVKVSIPRFERITALMDELNCDNSDRAMLEKVVSLDMAHQAIGRNSGYRWSDKENHEERKHCIVLADPKLAKTFYEKSRYYIKRYIPNPESVIELKREYNNAIDGLCWFLTYLNRYICFGLEREKLAVINDYKEVLKKAGCVDKKILLVRRLYRNLEGKRKRLVGEYGRVFPAIWTRFANVSDVQSRIIFSGEWAELY